MSSVLVRFKLRQRLDNTVLIDPDAVGAVFPRSDYTTLLVQGEFMHVDHVEVDVLAMLGRAAE